MFLTFANSIIQLVFILALAPLFTGIIKKMKALSQHRRGCSIFQVYFDIARLFNKEVVKSNVTSIIYDLAPYVFFITSLIAALCLPLTGVSFPGLFGDGIFVVYILVLGRIFIALAALDAGSTFGGMGSSREMFIASLVEPAFIMILFTLSIGSGETSLNFMPQGGSLLVKAFLAAGLFIVLIAETSRIPVDDPSTHLELTMVHEAMILEYSGRQLALVEWGVSIKQFFYIGFISSILIPGISFHLQGILGGLLMLIILVIKAVIVTLVVAFIEIKAVKMRFFNITNLTTAAFVFSFIGFILSFI